ncbi:endonuclease domain-containing protein [Novosphingobium sp. CCH12-A3]|uniref:endonuclease domain-containing protein n=1 Tax=Novosphingobium sp. CCH12-A3 TaxID=1768752 RepID=UPI0007829E55|nr:DUF559 domain-containing protein [Novosphingobium sp. CCH12-A3]
MREFKPRNTTRARELRREATPMERKLWRYLSGGALGAKFSRQMPVGPYFADFLCRELMIVVELDGHSHDLRLAHDAARDRFMAETGYKVLRFTNADVQSNVEGVATAIQLAIEARRQDRSG